MPNRYSLCPCGGKINFDSVTYDDNGIFVTCDSCGEKFPISEKGVLIPDAMIDKISRLIKYHEAAIGGLNNGMDFWINTKKIS